MDFHHLRRLVAGAEELHFARAAEGFVVEQSLLSRSIRNLRPPLFEWDLLCEGVDQQADPSDTGALRDNQHAQRD